MKKDDSDHIEQQIEEHVLAPQDGPSASSVRDALEQDLSQKKVGTTNEFLKYLHGRKSARVRDDETLPDDYDSASDQQGIASPPIDENILDLSSSEELDPHAHNDESAFDPDETEILGLSTKFIEKRRIPRSSQEPNRTENEQLRSRSRTYLTVLLIGGLASLIALPQLQLMTVSKLELPLSKDSHGDRQLPSTGSQPASLEVIDRRSSVPIEASDLHTKVEIPSEEASHDGAVDKTTLEHKEEILPLSEQEQPVIAPVVVEETKNPILESAGFIPSPQDLLLPDALSILVDESSIARYRSELENTSKDASVALKTVLPPSEPKTPKSSALYIQVGAFTVLENASTLMARLKQAGFEAEQRKVTIGSRVFHRVLVAANSQKEQKSNLQQLDALEYITETPIANPSR